MQAQLEQDRASERAAVGAPSLSARDEAEYASLKGEVGIKTSKVAGDRDALMAAQTVRHRDLGPVLAVGGGRALVAARVGGVNLCHGL